MNSFPELGAMLRTLRLSGMLDSLEVRNRQALQEHMAPIDEQSVHQCRARWADRLSALQTVLGVVHLPG